MLFDPNWGMVSASNDWLTMERYPEGKYGQDRSGATAVSGAIDVTSRSFRVEAYTPPIVEEDNDQTTSSHNHRWVDSCY